MDYDQAYREAPALFGAGPGTLLKSHCQTLDPDLPVLDLGCGQGRHSLYLARLGWRVTALDPSAVAVQTVARVARAESLPVRVEQGGFESHDAEEGSYGGALVYGLIQILTRDGIARLVANLHRWIAPGGLLFATAFSTADPRYPEVAAAWKRVGPHAYITEDGEPRTYLEPDEILQVFEGWGVVHHWEGLGPEHRHGDSPPERHARIEVVLRR